jgi:hypothetical protein
LTEVAKSICKAQVRNCWLVSLPAQLFAARAVVSAIDLQTAWTRKGKLQPASSCFGACESTVFLFMQSADYDVRVPAYPHETTVQGVATLHFNVGMARVMCSGQVCFMCGAVSPIAHSVLFFVFWPYA